MMELTIKGQVYQFNFGMGFLREINKQTNVPVDGAPGSQKRCGISVRAHEFNGWRHGSIGKRP